jgi:hypothetical protein
MTDRKATIILVRLLKKRSQEQNREHQMLHKFVNLLGKLGSLVDKLFDRMPDDARILLLPNGNGIFYLFRGLVSCVRLYYCWPLVYRNSVSVYAPFHKGHRRMVFTPLRSLRMHWPGVFRDRWGLLRAAWVSCCYGPVRCVWCMVRDSRGDMLSPFSIVFPRSIAYLNKSA